MSVKPGLLCGLLIATVGFAAYCNSFAGQFVLDDERSILVNPDLKRSLTLSRARAEADPERFISLWRLLFDFGLKDAPTAGRPIVGASFYANYKLEGYMDPDGAAGKDPTSYHAFNLAVHLLAALAMFGLVHRTLLRMERFRAGAIWIALASALIWVVHPIQTSAVTYLSQRAESLMALFFFISFYCVLRGAGSSRPWRGWYPAALLACALCVGSKEVGAVLPPLILLYDRIYLAPSGAEGARWRWVLETRSWRELLRRRGLLYAGLFATWGISIGLLMTDPRPNTVVAPWSLEAVGEGFRLRDLDGIDPWNYATTQLNAILKYLGLVVWPQPLVLDYGWEVALEWREYAVAALVVSGLLALSLWALIFHPKLGFPALWSLVILAPSSSVVAISTEMMAEHRMYLPLAGIIVLLVAGAHRLVQASSALPEPLRGQAGRLAAAAVLGIVAALALLSFQRNELYKSPVALWEANLRATPGNPRAQINYGTALYEQGRAAEALEAYEEAARLARAYQVPKEPKLDRAIENIAKWHFNAGHYREAALWFQELVDRAPDLPMFQYELGRALISAGDRSAAMDAFTRAAELAPRWFWLRQDIARLYVEDGQYRRAVSELARLRGETAGSPEATLIVALMLKARGQSRESTRLLQMARRGFATKVRTDASDPRLQNDLGRTLMALGELEASQRRFLRAIEIDPEYASAHQNLGTALLRQNRVSEAIRHFELALAEQPDLTAARRQLEKARQIQRSR
jgi:tetratricopeptide (TPR) repeat protein